MIYYFNGSYHGVENLSPKEVGHSVNDGSIIRVKNVGAYFRGKPIDMAGDALSHVKDGFFPVIIESWSGTDSCGDYTTEVVFQAIRCY